MAESLVTLGVSTERGTVHAVALADGEKLAERVRYRWMEPAGDSPADAAVAVETALDALAAQLGSDREIGGVAVAYRDAAQRRAIVTRLAAGPWHTASMVSAKSAHLSAAGMMTWLDTFDNLLICEVVRGYQAFTLVDRGRRRVLAAVGQAAGATWQSLGATVTAAWDQLDAAETRPDAVTVIGSEAGEPDVQAAVEGFGAPVFPCRLSAFAAAAGAAANARMETETYAEPVAEPHRVRGGVALFTAAGVLAGGVVAGGTYLLKTPSRPAPSVVAVEAGADSVEAVEAGAVSGGSGPGRRSAADGQVPGPLGPVTGSLGPVMGYASTGAQRSGERSGAFPGRGPLRLVPAGTADEETADAPAPRVPGTGIPSNPKLGPPNGALLFPGEAPPPAAFTPEAADWWDEHLRLMAQWAVQQMLQI
ncbi:hypothetical protein ACL02S_11625 [Nocardia sp. 004]|uniref:hypothetical protein n=1 Tax=Nocardia sp. 004 TaxID=3385978 RepID=UPI00399F9FC7